ALRADPLRNPLLQPLQQPGRAETCGQRGRDEDRQVISVLVVGDLIVERVGQIPQRNKCQEEEQRSIAPPQRDQSARGQRQYYWEPRRSEFARQEFQEDFQLLPDAVGRKRQCGLILAARDVRPDPPQSAWIAPIHHRPTRRAQRQIGVYQKESCEREPRGVTQALTLEELHALCAIYHRRQSRQRQRHRHVVDAERQTEGEGCRIDKAISRLQVGRQPCRGCFLVGG